MKKGICLLLSLSLGLVLCAQDIRVSGSVKDASGNPVVGATVLVAGTTRGTTADADGRYAITGVREGATLTCQSLGYTTEQAAVTSPTVDFVLRESATALNEVVVVGYGSVRRADMTGSVSSVRPDEINKQPTPSFEKSLQGRIAGVQVVNDNKPGGGATIRIRGGSSIYSSNTPLLVVDGFPIGDAGNLKQISPEDIETIDVLKDASASAIYGSRGANGVIIVTTKRAKAGVTRVTVSNQTTIGQYAQTLDTWRDPLLMAQLSNESRINGGMTPLYIGAKDPLGTYYPSLGEIASGAWGHNTDWESLVMRGNPVSTNTSASVSTAGEKTSFNLNLSYLTQQGTSVKDRYRKGTVNMAVTHKFNKYVTLKVNEILSRDHTDVNQLWLGNPLFPVYNDDGTYYKAHAQDYSNAVAFSDTHKDFSNAMDNITMAGLDLHLADWLTVTSQVSYKYASSVKDSYLPPLYSQQGDLRNGYGQVFNDFWQNVTAEAYATFNKTWGKHTLTAMAGYSYTYDDYKNSVLSSEDFINSALGNENMESGKPEKMRVKNGKTASELVSGMFRINYSLADKYLVTFTARADGSTKFGDNNKWAFFPSGAVSWKMHNERFLRNVKQINELKLRVSYGTSGNQGISPYQTLPRYGTNLYYYQGAWSNAIGQGIVTGYEGDGRILVYEGLGNTGLKWETTTQLNVGLDYAMFDNRLRLTFDWYDKKTDNLLRDGYLAPSTSFDRVKINGGSVRNRGFEVTLAGDIVATKDWGFSATAVFSRNRNKVLTLGNAASVGLNQDKRTGMNYQYWGSLPTMFRETGVNILAIGKPVNVFYGFKTDGIVQSLYEGMAAGLTGDMARPGEIKYVDISENGSFGEEDKCIIGDPNPDFLASLTLSLRWKNFDAELFFNGSYGNDVINTQAFGTPQTMSQRWTADNPNNRYPSLRESRHEYRFSDFWVEDGSYLKLQNLNIGYNLRLNPRKCFLSNIRIAFNVTDLFTVTGFSGYDPQMAGLDGIYWGGLPSLRQYTFDFKFTF